MKKVDNEIQKELSYNYHTAFEADRVINMTEYFDRNNRNGKKGMANWLYCISNICINTMDSTYNLFYDFKISCKVLR